MLTAEVLLNGVRHRWVAGQGLVQVPGEADARPAHWDARLCRIVELAHRAVRVFVTVAAAADRRRARLSSKDRNIQPTLLLQSGMLRRQCSVYPKYSLSSNPRVLLQAQQADS